MFRLLKKEGSIKEFILSHYGLNESDLDVSNFKTDFFEPALVRFYEVLIANKDENFFIVGDYDFDGISAVTVICRLLDELKIRHNYYIPSRIKEGYGINLEMVERAHQYGFTAILTLDNGIVANDCIAKAKEYGLKFLIIDHHEYHELPNADAILHPSLLSDDYKDACTAGLCALLFGKYAIDDYALVLGGLATLADMSGVFGYNRYLVKKAMFLLNEKNFPLVNMLAKKKNYDYVDLSFSVIPKVNAVSRMGYSANKMVTYFMSGVKEAMVLSDSIEACNIERKKYTKEMMDKAFTLVDESDLPIVYDESFREGLCGIVAGRLSEKLMKPILVLSSDQLLKGSGRSFGDFNLFQYLQGCKELFATFGGHDKAIGLTIEKKNLNQLKEYIRNHPISFKEEEKVACLMDAYEYSLKTMEEIESLMPFGTGFKEISFAVKKSQLEEINSPVYKKYRINENCEAILFDNGKYKEDYEYIVGRLSRNSYKKESLTLMIDEFL